MEAVWADARLDVTRVTLKSDAATGYTRFQDGDVLLPKITPTFEAGRSVLISGLRNGVGAGTTELHVLRPTREIDPRYLTYITQSRPFLKLGEAEMYGVAGQKRVPDDFVRDFRVDLPAVEEQRRIADFLDLETKRISQLRELTQRQQWLETKRLSEFLRLATSTSSGVPNRETGLSWMPVASTAWPLLKVSYAFATGSGTTPSSNDAKYFEGDVPWVNSGDVPDGPITTTVKAVTSAALRDYPALKMFPPGALVVAMYGAGATKGRVGVLSVSACVNQACCVLMSMGRITAEFAYYWFRSHRDGIVRLAAGAGQPNLSQELIRKLKMPAPALCEQVNIVQTIQRQENVSRVKIEALRKRQDLLAERRQALITAAITGQIDPTTARGGHE
ncbi:restriction endonuclease subunit S [Micromonospora sp. WMMD1076]|uniref:restriction endonuclease subunit S n=1 Tax=Micromonospora sp. WMMD1076 TaxID=3016103 RepID=UPI00249A1BFD|nr:restriction endonuclease subunit S [Micromonospora sp. WMMD1076]WFF05134.1 restriction endonuclease subunit S [Micromonospora sp. WMMD1076]